MLTHTSITAYSTNTTSIREVMQLKERALAAKRAYEKALRDYEAAYHNCRDIDHQSRPWPEKL